MNKKIGYDLLGPVMHRWLMGLHQYISYLDDDTAFLFCSRAGVRIKKLYNIFLGCDGFTYSPESEIFWMSRVSIAKGIFGRSREISSNHIAREYYHHPLSDLVAGLLRNNPTYLKNIDLSAYELKAHGFNFNGWILSEQHAARILRDYLNECTHALDAYLDKLLDGRKKAVLIDSGWQGSAQSMLSNAHSDIDWQGLYFGRILTPDHDPSIIDKVIGVMFEADQINPEDPITAFVKHRHIIETLLEPNAPSVEEVPMFQFEEAAQSLIEKNINDVPDPEKDSLYLHVEQYIQDNVNLNFSKIEANYQAVVSELARILIHPRKDEALALFCKDRSADFGKQLKVPVLIDPRNNEYESADERISASLWPEGQIALEYSGKVALDLQSRVAGLSDNQGYFDPHGTESIEINKSVYKEKSMQPKVAIITRTKNRPLLLERAARSVACQSYSNYEWVIVNDGGDEDAVRDVVASCAVDVRKITLVNNSRSLGMEAASNVGIRNSDSKYLVIHDDDDSWAPEFLNKAVAYLESAAGKRYGGVITHTLYVSEEIKGDRVVEHERRPYQDWVRNVQLAEMAIGNFFPPIAFVFRRSLWEDIGGYNEDLPVLGDWYFNLEFLLRADIGVIPEPLAYYHHRDRGDSRSGIYANSVIGGISKHEEFASIARNEFLRRNLEKFPAAIGVLLGYTTNVLRDNSGVIQHQINSLGGKVEKVTSELISIAQGNSTQLKDRSHPSLDLVDKYWAVTQLNIVRVKEFRSNSGKLPWKNRMRNQIPFELLDPLCSWEDIEAVLLMLKEIAIPEDFNESEYLRLNPDVAKAVQNSSISSGYYHYLLHGRKEGRMRPTCNR
ncbi:glycosyltransferase [Microbulbifer thermotolerans]|uniref:glycosyltransferase family 2 protein n=1 Tax=Microbulbifer thermotolerans TaxID=252514 RepID=UPI00224B9D00|nr:glycosyltransferase [Microbulbifer thermotolerans]MCX2842540.1 glycosyltransferase [Microbulbifer thermotolerans]